jgi:hypothetical protein
MSGLIYRVTATNIGKDFSRGKDSYSSVLPFFMDVSLFFKHKIIIQA